ncbi:trypsin-like peptidase domain-containing protein [Microtetraspora sp. NBRC 16547]|uniref:nSTAND1 domain-containing NTPase n=1 Tax=Microtetraspora sp. NBRC 16547 TaxID=3030993 RepID=UPI0024A5ACD4|nr:trypsin-like peptidase domain-containing protein [Microtetraspora sp. NBRC 16547]GLX02033.1 hypothetical protein Misp02_61190 [Microtetraspora sp. NBRC 16547]
MAETGRTWSDSPDEDLAAAIVQIKGQHGALGGAGFLITPDLVLTCAHVVSDALEKPRQEPVPTGTPVTVELPLAPPPVSGGPRPAWLARVENWVPIRAERTGDIAVLRLPEPIPGTHPLPMADPDKVEGGQVRAVGFTRDAPGGIWFEGKLVGATGEGWVQLSRATGQAAHVKPGFSGSPVWDNALRAVVGLLVAAQPESDAQQAYALRTKTIVREIPTLGPAVRPPSPFRGLETYRENDGHVFCGRDGDIAEVVTALRSAHTVTVYGPSGCGKSSLALAGVVPRMRDAGYKVLVVNAGRISSPRSALATELFEAVQSERHGPARAHSADQVEGWLKDKGIADTLHRAWGTASVNLLVVLDQAEALLNRTQTEIDELIDLLFPQRHPVGGLRVLVTLRSDLMDAVLKHPRLGPALRGGLTLPLTPMARDQLQEVITKPVKPPVAYEPGLVRRILDDAGAEPGILPLLGFVLQQLWEKADGGYLRNKAYEDMGGVFKALEKHADQAWKDCVGEQAEVKAAAKRLLTGLVQVPPGGERQMPVRRTLTRAEAGEQGWQIAEAFARRRLLVLDRGKDKPETAELAHEALIMAWPALRRQVEDDRTFLTARAELDHDLRRWKDPKRSALPAPAQLAALDQWLGKRESELSEEQREFLELARRRQRARRRRTRAVWTALALVAALIVGLGTFLGDQMQVSAERAAEGRSRAIASLTQETATTDPGLAALAAIAAYKTAPTQEARSALLRRYDQFKDAAWALTGVQGPTQDVAMSADGSVTLATSGLGRATLFVRHASGRVLRKHLNLADNVFAPLVSRDGRRIAYILKGQGSVVWHDVRPTANDIIVGPARRLRGGELTQVTLGGLQGSFSVAAFSPNADQVAAVALDGKLRVWDVTTQQLRTLPQRLPPLQQVWFGPDENTLVAVRRDSTVDILSSSVVSLDIRTGKIRDLEDRHSTSGQRLDAADVSADGGVLVVCRGRTTGGGKATYRAARVADGRELTRYTPPGDYSSCRHPAIDQTGEHIAINEGNGNWALLDARPGKHPQRFFGASSISYGDKVGPLLGNPGDPIVVHRSETGVTGWRMIAEDGAVAFSPPKLLDHGKTMVVRLGEHGDRLSVRETEGQERTLAEVRNDATTPPDAKQELAVNGSETLLADVADHNRITIRDLPDLRTVAEFTTRMPPMGKDGKRELVSFFFISDEELVTASGGVVEHWNARDGRRLSNPLDIRDLRIDGVDPTEFFPQPLFPEPGHVQFVNLGDHTLRAVNLRTGTENPDLRIRLGPDMLTAVVNRSGRLALVLTRGSMIELWSVQDRRRPQRVLGPLGPLEPNRWQIGGWGDSGFFLANGNSVRFMSAADPGRIDIESYDFADKQGFLASADGGKALLRNPMNGGHVDMFRLDPMLWQRHLCNVLGGDLSQDERRILPPGLPDVLCPPR